jgi:phenylacetate-CoA ligase
MTQERKYWDEKIETMPLEELKKFQEERLREVVERAYRQTALYRRKFDQAGVKPEDIKTLEDLPKLPFTEYLEDYCSPPQGPPLKDKMAVPMSEVDWVHSTSGTVSGFSQPRPLTAKDTKEFIDGEARYRWTAGVRPHDVVQILTGFDCCYRGYIHLGAKVFALSAGRGNMDFQIKLAQMMGATVIEHLPSLMLTYFDRARQLGIDLKQSGLRMVSGAGEGWAEAYKAKVEAEYGIPFRTGYGSVEGGLVSAQCEAGDGMHLMGDFVIVEIIDPETKRVLPIGEAGEVITTLLKGSEAMPLIRYRMGDVAKLLPYKPCPCGRTHPKISMVKGRVGDYITVKGKKLLPIDVEEVIASIPGLGYQYQIILQKPGEQDRLKVQVEHTVSPNKVASLEKRLKEALTEQLGVPAEVELLPLGSVPRKLFKAMRIIKPEG